MDKILIEESLARLITRGGIFYDVPGDTCEELLANIIKKESLLQAVMEREALISTGIENGIALPHPRIPMLEENEKPFVAIAFPKNFVQDWKTPDNSKIHTFFLIVSESPKQHLGVMSKISFLCHQKSFYKLLKERAAEDLLIKSITEIENEWL